MEDTHIFEENKTFSNNVPGFAVEEVGEISKLHLNKPTFFTF
jgi:hypothetical protein